MVICEHCWAGEMVLLNGMLTCEACGEVQQDFVEEQEEFMAGINDRGFFRKSTGHGLAKGGSRRQAREPLPTRAALAAYVREVQALLGRQGDALVGRFGVDPGVRALLRQLWFAYLPMTGVLEEDFADTFEEKFEPTLPSEEEQEEEEDGRESNPPTPRRGRHSQVQGWHFYSLVMQRTLAPVLHYRLTLSLLLLACWYLREAVGPADLVRWASDGQLPYLHWGLEAWPRLAPFRKLFTPKWLNPKGTPGPKRLLQTAGELACRLGLDLPPVNAAAWMERYLAELALPQELLPVCLQLCRLYRFGPQYLGLTAPVHPWANVMAALVVAVKLCYGLDGRTRELPPGLPPMSGWARWARKRLGLLSSTATFPSDAAGVLSLSAAQFTALCAWITTVVVPPNRLAQRGWRRRTAQLGSPAFQALAAAAIPVHGAEPADAELEQGGSSGGAGPGGHAAALPPLPASAYHFFERGHASSRLPPDYVALLTACAACVWLTPLALHKLVLEVEEALINAECEVAYQGNALEAARMAQAAEWRELAASGPRRREDNA